MKKALPIIASIYIAFVFIQSLFFKFTGSTETDHIFTTIDQWAEGFGLGGLLGPGDPLGPITIGSAELVASILLLLAIAAPLRMLRPYGAAMAVAIMTGAISFHLFTPLGVNVQGDGGILFYMACGVWVAGLYLLFQSRDRWPIFAPA